MAKRRGAVRYSSRHLGYIPDTQLIAPKIKKLHTEGMTISQLSARFSLSYPVIWKVIHGKKKKQQKNGAREKAARELRRSGEAVPV